MTNPLCEHFTGYDYYEGEFLQVVDDLEDPSKVQFNYCPWCGKSVEEIYTSVKYFYKEDDADCQKRGCAD